METWRINNSQQIRSNKSFTRSARIKREIKIRRRGKKPNKKWNDPTSKNWKKQEKEKRLLDIFPRIKEQGRTKMRGEHPSHYPSKW